MNLNKEQAKLIKKMKQLIEKTIEFLITFPTKNGAAFSSLPDLEGNILAQSIEEDISVLSAASQTLAEYVKNGTNATIDAKLLESLSKFVDFYVLIPSQLRAVVYRLCQTNMQDENQHTIFYHAMKGKKYQFILDFLEKNKNKEPEKFIKEQISAAARALFLENGGKFEDYNQLLVYATIIIKDEIEKLKSLKSIRKVWEQHIYMLCYELARPIPMHYFVIADMKLALAQKEAKQHEHIGNAIKFAKVDCLEFLEYQFMIMDGKYNGHASVSVRENKIKEIAKQNNAEIKVKDVDSPLDGSNAYLLGEMAKIQLAAGQFGLAIEYARSAMLANLVNKTMKAEMYYLSAQASAKMKLQKNAPSSFNYIINAIENNPDSLAINLFFVEKLLTTQGDLLSTGQAITDNDLQHAKGKLKLNNALKFMYAWEQNKNNKNKAETKINICLLNLALCRIAPTSGHIKNFIESAEDSLENQASSLDDNSKYHLVFHLACAHFLQDKDNLESVKKYLQKAHEINANRINNYMTACKNEGFKACYAQIPMVAAKKDQAIVTNTPQPKVVEKEKPVALSTMVTTVKGIKPNYPYATSQFFSAEPAPDSEQSEHGQWKIVQRPLRPVSSKIEMEGKETRPQEKKTPKQEWQIVRKPKANSSIRLPSKTNENEVRTERESSHDNVSDSMVVYQPAGSSFFPRQLFVNPGLAQINSVTGEMHFIAPPKIVEIVSASYLQALSKEIKDLTERAEQLLDDKKELLKNPKDAAKYRVFYELILSKAEKAEAHFSCAAAHQHLSFVIGKYFSATQDAELKQLELECANTHLEKAQEGYLQYVAVTPNIDLLFLNKIKVQIAVIDIQLKQYYTELNVTQSLVK